MILLEYTEDGFVGFNHGGEFITDPFFDETNKKTVNPFTYYGISKSDLNVMIKENRELSLVKSIMKHIKKH